MPIRINATKPRTTKTRSFNRDSFKGGRRNFNRSEHTQAPTFEQRNSLNAYITQAQAAPKMTKKQVGIDGWTTMASKKHITMRTPARHHQMIQRNQNQFAALNQPEKKKVVVALPTVVKYKAPTGVWGKPLAEAVKEDIAFDHVEAVVDEEEMSPMELLGSLKPSSTVPWGDQMMDIDEEEDEDEEEFFYDREGRPMVDNSAW